MNNTAWKIATGVLTTVLAAVVLGGLAYGAALYASGWPPYERQADHASDIDGLKKTVTGMGALLGSEIRASGIATQLEGYWRFNCADKHRPYALTMARLERDYVKETGLSYMLPACPP